MEKAEKNMIYILYSAAFYVVGMLVGLFLGAIFGPWFALVPTIGLPWLYWKEEGARKVWWVPPIVAGGIYTGVYLAQILMERGWGYSI